MSDSDDLPGLSGARLKRRLAGGEVILCATVRYSRTIEIAQIAKLAGYDALYCDLEHSTLALDDVAQIAQAAALAGVVPFARVPCHDHHWISRVLDGGCHGVIVPHVDDAATARACVDASRYPPLGTRSLAGYGPLAGLSVGIEESYRLINGNTVLVVMLESPEAIENAESIAAVDGVDMLLIGTNDLCAEMGIPGQLDDPKVLDAYRRTAAACRKHGRALGIGGIKEGPVLEEIVAMGGNFIMGRVDGVLLQQAATAEVKALRAIAAKKN